MRGGWLGFVFAVAVGLALAFAGLTLWNAAQLGEDGPAAVEGWMTPGLVALSRGVDEAAVVAALGGAVEGLTLEEIAAARGVPLAEVLAAVQAVVDAGAVR